MSLVLFFRGLLAYLVAYGTPLNDRYLGNTAEIRLVSYLLRPLSWLYIYCFVEGVVRSLDAILSEGNLGITLSHVLWKAGGLVGGVYERRRKEFQFGPRRPDEIHAPGRGASGFLEIYSVEDKPWFDRQVVRYQEELYIFVSQDMAKRDNFQSHHYCFRRLEPEEIIRGEIVELASGS